MMFALRGIAISFSVFFILYSALSFAVCITWRSLARYLCRFPASRYADSLFFLRMLPIVSSVGVTVVFAVPSFLRFEPRSVKESIGIVGVLGACGVAVLLAAIWSSTMALVKTSRTVTRWSNHASVLGRHALNTGQIVPVLRTSMVAPPLTVAGIIRPRIWLSGLAERMLTPRELHAALQHELIHVRRRDNLRKLILKFAPFPGMAQLESEWHEATEMATDDAAVSSASQALDLAAAVIKLSGLILVPSPADLTTALVHTPAELLSVRVQRLIHWKAGRCEAQFSGKYTAFAALGTVVMLGMYYSEVLVKIHAATECLLK
jgi:beta-lactamase regulating signal transducer with metallopeptidase domain